MPTIWVAVLHISAQTRRKLVERHGLDPDELRRRLVGVPGLRFAWDDHPQRGRRAIVVLPHGRRQLFVVLYPTPDPDTWHLGSAYLVFVGRRWHHRSHG